MNQQIVNGSDVLKNYNFTAGHFENAIKTKGQPDAQKMMFTDATYFNMAPTTVESKDILQ